MLKLIGFIICVQLVVSGWSQGVQLLYKGGPWERPSSWMQINNVSGQTPIQRVPTELDDLVFSQTLSGVAMASFVADEGSMVFNIGSNLASGKRCRSMHISNTKLNFEQNFTVDLSATLHVYTGNGGFVRIDSGSNVSHGFFVLHGGDPAKTDLEISNSHYGDLFSHADWSGINVLPNAKARLINSTIEGWSIGTSDNGGEFYADQCIIKTGTFRIGENSTGTVLNSSIVKKPNIYYLSFFIGHNAKFISENFNIEANADINVTTSGTVLHGNVRSDSEFSRINFLQQIPSMPLPNIIDGDIRVHSLENVKITGDLKISGDIYNSGMLFSPPDTNSVFVNNEYVFTVGGVLNYRFNFLLNNCIYDYCHFNLEFFGDKDSHITWPIGFPIDTLVVNKSGCSKLTSTNPLYISGATKIKSGQLLLTPNQSIPYKLVCNGDLQIMNGAGLVLGKDSSGAVANIAVAGSVYDYNTTVDSDCTGLSNPDNGTITLYSNATNLGTRVLSSAGNANMGDLKLISRPGSDFKFLGNFTVNNLQLIRTGE